MSGARSGLLSLMSQGLEWRGAHPFNKTSVPSLEDRRVGWAFIPDRDIEREVWGWTGPQSGLVTWVRAAPLALDLFSDFLTRLGGRKCHPTPWRKSP